MFSDDSAIANVYNVAPQRLAAAIDESAAVGRVWLPDELAQVLLHQLDAPLADDLANLGPKARRELQRLRVRTHGTFRDLLSDHEARRSLGWMIKCEVLLRSTLGSGTIAKCCQVGASHERCSEDTALGAFLPVTSQARSFRVGPILRGTYGFFRP